MSDFLGRLAARSVGHASTAQPRLPARFEDGLDRGVDDQGLEVVETEVVASPAEGARAEMDARSRPPSGGNSRQDPGAMQRSGAAPQSVPRRHEAARPGEPITPVTPASVVDAASRMAPPRISPPAIAELALAATPTEAPPLVTASVVTVQRSAEPAAGRPDELGRSIGVAAPEPPTVRVHIGRLEIRANLPEPRPSRPAPIGESETKSVSLSAYLRGSR